MEDIDLESDNPEHISKTARDGVDLVRSPPREGVDRVSADEGRRVTELNKQGHNVLKRKISVSSRVHLSHLSIGHALRMANECEVGKDE